MNSIFKKASLGTALAVTTIAALAATPAAAQPGRGDYRHGGDGAGVAVAAGILGLAVGASIANQQPYYGDEEPVGYASYGGPAGCYDGYPGYDACYPVADYYRMGWSWRDGSWWSRDGQRYAHPFMGRGGYGGGRGGYGGGYGGGYAGGGRGGYGGGHGGGGQGGGGYGGGHGGGGQGGGHGGGGGHR